MNAEVLRLLSQAGMSDEIGWKDLIVVQNYAGVAIPSTGPEIPSSHRGFNFVILDQGSPAFFCKCRPAGDAGLERETRIRSCLARGHDADLMVAPARCVASERIALQLGPFIKGSQYRRLASRQPTKAFIATLGRVLRGAGELAGVAREACRDVMPTEQTIDLRRSAAEGLQYVATNAPLGDELVAALAATLSEAGSVPSLPQHGDLWYQNLLLEGSRVWAVDFEDYGRIQCPLYDDITLLRSALELRPDSSGHGIERLITSSAEAVACRRILAARASAVGVDLRQLDGVLAYYAIVRAVTIDRRTGTLHGTWHMDEVRYVAERLAGGDRDLLSPTGEV